MPVRACLTCGALSPASYCPAHQPVKPKTPGRSSRPADRWRRAVLERATGRCQWVGDDGQRCPVTTGLQAHHLTKLRELHAQGADLADPALGVALCCSHHKLAEPTA